MIYRAIGVMSGSSLDGLDIAFAEFQENFHGIQRTGKWSYEIRQAACYPYTKEWTDKLRDATLLSAKNYQLLHVEYGRYIGERINQFIEENNLQYQVALIASHGHTTFHDPSKKMTAQLGDGAAIASETELPVVTDLRSLDVAFGGQGAPIVPIGEKLLLGEYDYFLNLGGIANISINSEPYLAFDICATNRVLNLLANESGKEFDDKGKLGATGIINEGLLQKLNSLDYYKQTPPKSLANEFGTDVVYPMIRDSKLSIADSLSTYVEHVAIQIGIAIKNHASRSSRLLVTGGGAFNNFLVERISQQLKELNVDVLVADEMLVKYKEALIMAFIGILRWRQENNVLASVTGAKRDSIGGALWIGQEA